MFILLLFWFILCLPSCMVNKVEYILLILLLFCTQNSHFCMLKLSAKFLINSRKIVLSAFVAKVDSDRRPWLQGVSIKHWQASLHRHRGSRSTPKTYKNQRKMPVGNQWGFIPSRATPPEQMINLLRTNGRFAMGSFTLLHYGDVSDESESVSGSACAIDTPASRQSGSDWAQDNTTSFTTGRDVTPSNQTTLKRKKSRRIISKKRRKQHV